MISTQRVHKVTPPPPLILESPETHATGEPGLEPSPQQTTISRLLLLNGLAILTVVMSHAIGWGFTAMFWWTDRYRNVSVPNFDQVGGVAYYSLRALEQLTAFPVPAFLFVSGYFVAFAASRRHGAVSWRVVRSRMKGLLPPYLIWSAAVLAFDVVKGRSPSVPEALWKLLTVGMTPAYYFIPLLCGCYLLSPIIVRLVRLRWNVALASAAAVELCIRALAYPSILGAHAPWLNAAIQLTPAWFVLTKIFWFVAGVAAPYYFPQLKIWVRLRKAWVLASAGALYIAGVAEWEVLCRLSGQPFISPLHTVSDALFAAALCTAILFIDDLRIPFSGVLQLFGRHSYGIYLMHILIVEIAADLLYHVKPAMLGSQLLFQPLMVALGIGVPLTFMVMVRRSGWKWVYWYVFGR